MGNGFVKFNLEFEFSGGGPFHATEIQCINSYVHIKFNGRRYQ